MTSAVANMNSHKPARLDPFKLLSFLVANKGASLFAFPALSRRLAL
ncbi:MAG: hypothetical protein LBO66_08110 [Deltaproteobacteria bacterium]|jgi:hypothetical protein|nr:hypothetical protein [Deltaproteobacteria bacterium]